MDAISNRIIGCTFTVANALVLEKVYENGLAVAAQFRDARLGLQRVVFDLSVMHRAICVHPRPFAFICVTIFLRPTPFRPLPWHTASLVPAPLA